MAPKRKGTSSSAASKKAKNSASPKKDQLSVVEIKRLAEKIISESSYNDLVILLNQYDYIKSSLLIAENDELETRGRQVTASIHQIIQKLFHLGLLKPKKSYDEKKNLLINWLIDKYEKFKKTINNFISINLAFESSLQLDMMDTMLKLVKLEAEYLRPNQDLYFPHQTYHDFIKALLTSEIGTVMADGTSDNFVLLEFMESFKKYYDLQVYFFQNLLNLVESLDLNPQRIFATYYTLVREKLLFTEDAKELKQLKTLVKQTLPTIAYKISNFKSQYQKGLTSILALKLSSSQYKSILLVLNKRMLPYMAQPASLMDFLTDCYTQNDNFIIQILSLNSLYELMKQYNLEYPDFYTKLFTLLTPGLLHNRYRSRFFRLCDLFLSSTHISSQLVASFIKKLCRLSMSAPTPGVVIVIPFIYNLLKRHPSCMIMIQNEKTDDYQDPFDEEELNPLKTKAINSSLWELEPLMTHFHPNVSTLAQIFKEPFRKPQYNLEDFLDWSYTSLLEQEQNRRYKSMAALEYESFDSMFGESGYLSGWST